MASSLNILHILVLTLLSRWRKRKFSQFRLWMIVCTGIPIVTGILAFWIELIGKPGCYWVGSEKYEIEPWRLSFRKHNIYCERLTSYLQRTRSETNKYSYINSNN